MHTLSFAFHLSVFFIAALLIVKISTFLQHINQVQVFQGLFFLGVFFTVDKSRSLVSKLTREIAPPITQIVSSVQGLWLC